MKKEKPREQTDAQEVRIRFEPGRMIFEVGESIFFLSEVEAGKIFGRAVGFEFEKLHGQDADFGGLRSIENYIRIQRLMRKGLGMDQVAKVLNVSQEKLRQFYSSERARPHTESWGVNEQEVERARQAGEEMDFVREARRERALHEIAAPEPGEKFIDLLQIKNLLRQNLRNEQIADHLGLDRKAFDGFLEKNKKYLDLI